VSPLRNVSVSADVDGLCFGFLGALSRRLSSPFRNDPPWDAGKPPTLLLVSQIAIGLVIAGITALLIVHSYRDTMAAATLDLQNRALILSEQADAALHAVEISEIAFLQRIEAESMRSPEDFRRALSNLAADEKMLDPRRGLPQLDAISAIDTEGNLINFSRSWPVPDVNLADRDYFKTLTADPKLRVLISEPEQNRSTGTWMIFLARKAVAADGTFLGILLGAIQLSYFEELYQAVVPAGAGTVSLFRRDGSLLVRFPPADAQVGRSFGHGKMFTFMTDSDLDSTIARQVSLFDGEDRLIAAHRLRHYPLAVTASGTISYALAPWRAGAAYFVAVAVILELAVVGVGLLMLRQLRYHRMLHEARAARLEAEAARRSANAELAVAHERERTDRELQIQNARFGAALSTMSQALALFDAADRLVMANSQMDEILGVPPGSSIPGMTIGALQALTISKSSMPPSDVRAIHDGVAQFSSSGKRMTLIRELMGGRVLAMNLAAVEDGGWLMTLEDITEQRLAAAKMSHMAHHDALTGLPNRVLFHAKLCEAVARSARGDCSALLYLDLDHFKAVNDTLNHPIGDALLREVTSRLLHYVRETDSVARLGGDEFAIVQSSFDQPRESTALARRLVEVLGEPYEIDGYEVVIGASIGIAIIPGDGLDPDELLKNADLALYRAKGEGRGRYRFFEPEMDARMQARRTLELDLRKALVHGEFEVFYQPLIDIQTRTISGFEALVRWFHPERGLTQPADFVPLAEEMGLVVPLGEFVLRRACADAVTWPGNAKVAVNLSPVQFGSHTLVADVAAALEDSGLDPHRLELEITETVMLEDTEGVLMVLRQLRDLGVELPWTTSAPVIRR
jgi:diguanylate cyclase (GGDEF)-like protein